jgi:hypothetical protein
MRKVLSVLAAAGFLALGSGAASAQGVNVRIGVDDGPRHRVERRVVHGLNEVQYTRVPEVRRRVIERRVVRPVPPTRTVCRTVIRERVRPSGVVVRRPTEVCRQTVVGRRVYVD